MEYRITGMLVLFLCIVCAVPGHQALHNGGDIKPSQQQATSTMYAFSAELSTHVALAAGSPIIFDREITNVGGLYFPSSGQFFCPDDGVYVFVWSIQKDTGTAEGMQCITLLRAAGMDKKFGPKTSYYSSFYSGVTEMTAVVQCSSPSAFTVNVVPWSDTEVISQFRAGRTSFSGFKLQTEIGFTAELSEDSYVINTGRVMFDNVLSNVGGHYDVVNGRFRCPDDGIYVFSVSTYCRDAATPWSVSRLMKEGEVVVQGPITYIATEAYDSGSSSITVVLQCATQHSVYVETQSAHDFIYNSYGSALSSFSGYKLYDVSEGGVAFTAVMSNNHTTIYDHQPLPFDLVITNIGDAYNPQTYAFQCPDDDYYLFTWSVTATYSDGYSNFDLYMDDTYVRHSYLTPQTSGDETGTSGTATISVIKQCETGARVQVHGKHVNERILLGGYTMFSGYKIPGDLATQK